MMFGAFVLSWRAVTSFAVSVARRLCVPVRFAAPGGPKPPVGKIVSVLVPRPASWFCTAAEDPAPTAMRMITAATPMRMPNIVSAERRRFDMIPWSARRRLSIMQARPRARRSR